MLHNEALSPLSYIYTGIMRVQVGRVLYPGFTKLILHKSPVVVEDEYIDSTTKVIHYPIFFPVALIASTIDLSIIGCEL